MGKNSPEKDVKVRSIGVDTPEVKWGGGLLKRSLAEKKPLNM